MADRLYYFKVSGITRFPFQLLYADQAWPASVRDAEAIEYAAPTQHKEMDVTLCSRQAPRVKGWREIGWPISRVETF